jgi:hypothetical protein
VSGRRWKDSACGLSQQAVEAGGSLIREAPGRVGAAPTTTGQARTARWPGSGKRDGKVQAELNQWSTPRKSRTGSNLVDMGRAAVHACLRTGQRDSDAGELDRPGGHAEGLRRRRGEAAGEKLGTAPVNRDVGNVGTLPGLPLPPCGQHGGGQVRRRPRAVGGDGAAVVLGGRESRPQGEGRQPDRSTVAGKPGGRW